MNFFVNRHFVLMIYLCHMFSVLVAVHVTSSAKVGKTIAGLVVKTDISPFFVKMRAAATDRSRELVVELRIFSGGHDRDTRSWADAAGWLVAVGAKGTLIAPSYLVALSETFTRARRAGLLAIALDTPFDPANIADAAFATDNFHFPGQPTDRQMGQGAAGHSTARKERI